MGTPQPKLFKINTVTYCQTFNCRKKAVYAIGTEGSPLQACHPLCAECAKSIIANVPEELLPHDSIEASQEAHTDEQSDTQVLGEVHICEVCSAEFPTRKALSGHMLKHRKESQ